MTRLDGGLVRRAGTSAQVRYLNECLREQFNA